VGEKLWFFGGCFVREDAIAGKPAPTGYVSYSHFVIDTNPVGASLLAMTICQAT